MLALCPSTMSRVEVAIAFWIAQVFCASRYLFSRILVFASQQHCASCALKSLIAERVSKPLVIKFCVKLLNPLTAVLFSANVLSQMPLEMLSSLRSICAKSLTRT